MVTSMSPFSPQAITPQKRHLENSLEKAESVIRSGGISKKSFYGSCKRTKLLARINKLVPDSWEENKNDVYEFDENGETPSESPFTRVVKSHEIGFPNPPGTNICWMNATLQIILGMRPLIDELESRRGGSVSRNHFSPILQSFLDLMRQYKRGRLLPVHKDLGNLKNALATLDAGFAGEHQQDAPEVLIRLLDTFREDFYELSKADKNDNGALKELKFENNNTQSPVPTPSDNGLKANPVCENLQFSMREHYCCTSCGVRSDRSQEHLTLYVDIPVEESVVSIDSALGQYMKTHTREMRCEKCNGGSCRVDTVFSQLPRILLIQVKRYTCQDNLTQKITSSIMIPYELNLRSVIDTDVVMPKPWTTEKREKENCVDTPKSSVVRGGGEEEDSYDEETDDEDDVNKFFYKLTGILSHYGDNPNAGHYVADVYHYAPNSWYHYDDESVERVKESDVLGNSREQSGYMFVYTYRPLYEDLRSRGGSTRSVSSIKLQL